MATYVQALPLPNGVELCTLVAAGYLSEGILLVAGLLDVLLARSAGLGLEADILVSERSRKRAEVLIA